SWRLVERPCWSIEVPSSGRAGRAAVQLAPGQDLAGQKKCAWPDLDQAHDNGARRRLFVAAILLFHDERLDERPGVFPRTEALPDCSGRARYTLASVIRRRELGDYGIAECKCPWGIRPKIDQVSVFRPYRHVSESICRRRLKCLHGRIEIGATGNMRSHL